MLEAVFPDVVEVELAFAEFPLLGEESGDEVTIQFRHGFPQVVRHSTTPQILPQYLRENLANWQRQSADGYQRFHSVAPAGFLVLGF
jgi:hypothetical protein